MKEHTHRATLNGTEDLGTFTRSDALLMKMSYQHITLEELEPEPAQMSKVEKITAKNLKTGLAIFLILALLGLALDQIV